MIPFLKSLLYDQAAAQRYFAMAAFLLGELATSGGVIPGTTTVIPGIQFLYPYGSLLKAVALYAGAGGALPSFKKVEAAIPPPKP